MKSVVTFHGVLAGAYEGGRKNLKALLIHASVDGGSNALCKGVKEDHLADDLGDPVTCPACIRKVAKL